MRRFRSIFVAAALGACDSPDLAKDPVWGKQPCGSCAMLVSEPAHAAQLVTTDGARHYFDDVGCMASWVAERRGGAAKLWVRDASGAWLDARTSRYRKGAKTPMNFGYAHAPDGAATWADIEAAATERARRP